MNESLKYVNISKDFLIFRKEKSEDKNHKRSSGEMKKKSFDERLLPSKKNKISL